MNIFKIFIPKDKAQEVTELESWTIQWKTQGDTYGSTIVNHKAFIKEEEAKEFEKQLIASAKFLNVWVKTNLFHN